MFVGLSITLYLLCYSGLQCSVHVYPSRGERIRSRLSLGDGSQGARESAFKLACESGNLERAKNMYTLGQVNYRCDQDYGLRVAAQNGHAALVEWLLSIGSSPKSASNFAIRRAAANGHEHVVALLLEHPETHPAANRMEALYRSARNGHAPVVSLLLRALPKPSLGIIGDIAMEDAIKCNDMGVFQAFYDDARVDRAQHDNYFLCLAAYLGRDEMVGQLLAVPEVHPGTTQYTAYRCPLVYAAGEGHVKVVKRLLDAGFDPTLGSAKSLRVAIKNGHLEVCQAIESSGRIAPSAKLNRALYRSAEAYPGIFEHFAEYYQAQQSLKASVTRQSSARNLLKGRKFLQKGKSKRDLKSPFLRGTMQEDATAYISLEASSVSPNASGHSM